VSPARKKAAARRATSRAAVTAEVKARVDAVNARRAAKERKRDRAARRQEYLGAKFGHTDLIALQSAMERALAAHGDAQVAATTRRPRRGARVMAVAANDTNRWVPIGPSVVRRGQADGRPRVAGRIRDLAVDSTGQRAYAASGKGGVWYTEDAGHSWRPVGGWASTPGVVGGLSTDMSCGCLQVTFGASAAQDYVMVGTGDEAPVTLSTNRRSVFPRVSGRGVLAGLGPAAANQANVPFEAFTGVGSGLENVNIRRIVRDPARPLPAQVAAVGDRVLAATTGGLYLGTRASVGGALQWQWTRVVGVDSLLTDTDPLGNAIPLEMCDVQWVSVPGLADGRLYIASPTWGVAFSDSLGANGSWNWLNWAGAIPNIEGRLSLSTLVGSRVYILFTTSDIPSGSTNKKHEPWLYRIPDANAAAGPGDAVRVRGVPSSLFSDSDAQREHDQAITVEQVGADDRVWLGGSAITPYSGADWSACLYAFRVVETGAGAPSLAAVTDVSRTGAPPAGEGANIAGLVGNSVHADVHCVRAVTLADGSRHVWVGCDGGVYVSELGGRVNTFASRNTGLATLESAFLANHPSSSQFCVLGSQDNGSQARTGDTVWEVTQLGDGGGQMFHPVASQYIITQYVKGTWQALPTRGFVGPLSRTAGGGVATGGEDTAASFYSGCDAVGPVAGLSRIAIGTDRVWISDDLGTTSPNTWRVIPFNLTAATATRDPRASNAEGATNRAFGTYVAPPVGTAVAPEPYPAFGTVQQLRWDGTRRIYAVYAAGIVRFDDDGTNAWTATVLLPSALPGAPPPATMSISDLAPVPGTTNFYITTLGDANTTVATAKDTLWFYQDADAAAGLAATFVPTGLRRSLPPADFSPPVAAPNIGPLDPAHGVVLDPDNVNQLYVGTTGGIWLGTRNVAAGTWAFTPFMNGLPITCVADLKIIGTTAAQPKLLRAATRSRGVWEVLLDNVQEPQRTYLRVHLRDDRRQLPTPMADPRLVPGTNAPVVASPDIVVRPAPRGAALPALAFPLAAGTSMGVAHNGSQHLWTFQTAFRWHFAAVRADAQWSDQLSDLVRAYRIANGLGNSGTINAATWNAVVGGTRITAARQLSAANTDAWAVFQPPWQTATATTVIPTEADIMELVQPLSVANDVWRVPREPSIVDVLLHHRDTRPVAADGAYVTVYRASAATLADLLALPAASFASAHSWHRGMVTPAVAGWQNVGGETRLGATLDAFMPKAISVPLDLSDAAITGPFVALIALCGATPEVPPVPTALPAGATIVDLVQRWPRAALRVIQLVPARRTVP
jgi:hypothetical protein